MNRLIRIGWLIIALQAIVIGVAWYEVNDKCHQYHETSPLVDENGEE